MYLTLKLKQIQQNMTVVEVWTNDAFNNLGFATGLGEIQVTIKTRQGSPVDDRHSPD